jgi:site-specific DNA recombinase
MISDGLQGKIDLIVTKSVSRFARNTVDTLIIVCQLKEKGGDIF